MTAAAHDQIAAHAVALPDDPATAVTIGRYYVEPGVTVHGGDPVCLLRSERYVYAIPAERAGVVARLLAPPGAIVRVGAPLIQLAGVPDEAPAPLSPGRRVTPLARRLAQIHKVDLQSVTLSGRGDRIRGADVRAALVSGAAPGPDGATASPGRDLQGVASRAPLAVGAGALHAATAIEVDCERMLSRRSGAQRADTAQQTVVSHLAAAVAAALIEHPRLNSSWSQDGIILHSRVDLSVTRGDAQQSVAIISRAGELNARGIARVLAASASRHHGDTKGQEQDITFMLIDGSDGSSDWTLPSRDTPHAAILHIGALHRRPVVLDGKRGAMIVPYWRSVMTLWYDVRLILQAEADAFLCAVRQRLRREQPL